LNLAQTGKRLNHRKANECDDRGPPQSPVATGYIPWGCCPPSGLAHPRFIALMFPGFW
jgi:hypothetical protein